MRKGGSGDKAEMMKRKIYQNAAKRALKKSCVCNASRINILAVKDPGKRNVHKERIHEY
jgi:hypothetical protein